jgi:hypothetical protein
VHEPPHLGVTAALVAALLALLAAALVGGMPGAAPSVARSVPLVGGVVPGEVNPAARAEVAPAFVPAEGIVALGPLADNETLSVVVGLSSAEPAGLAAYAATVGTGLALSDHPLSARAALARFGAPPASVHAAEAYFRADGVNVSANPDGLLLSLEGPAASIARAFGTSFERYATSAGAVFFDHPTPAVLPPIAAWTGVFGLANLTALTPTARLAPSNAVAPAASCGGPSGGLAPCSIWEAYNFSTLFLAGTNGSGATIAVVDAYSGGETENQLSGDLARFAANATLGVGGVNYLYPVPSSVFLNSSRTNPGWGLEEALDLEWARAAAPGATIDMTFSPNNSSGLYEAVDWLVASDRADVISLSWGEPDTGVFNAYDNACTAGCNASTDGSYAILTPVLELAAVEGITVVAASGDCGAADGTSGVATNFPASDPYATGVGGTVLTLTGAGAYSSETAWSGNHSGARPPGCGNQGGSGGGYSPFPRPWWQLGLPSTPSGRGVPDVAMDAGSPVAVIEGGGAVGVEGTSIGAPIWAGIAALADNYSGRSLGFLDPSLYRLATGSSHALYFHDITSGKNNYSAGVGWDPVTGEGTPLVDALVPALTQAPPLTAGTLTATLGATPRFGSAPLSVAFSFTVAGGTGPYRLEGVSFGNSNATLSSNGSARYVYTNPGVYAAQAFAIDATGNVTASSPVVVAVGVGWPLGVTLSAYPTSPAARASVQLNATVRGGTGPYSYTFYFGDGSYSLNASTPTVTHAYATPGSFCAVVTVTDAANPPDVGQSDPLAIPVGGGPTTACAGSVPLGIDGGPQFVKGVAPLSDSFSVEAYGGSGPPYSYLWTLPNGTTDTAENLTLTFGSPGSYSVSLQAAGPSGPSVLENWTIVVEPSGFFPPYVLLILAAGIGVAAAVVALEYERGPRRPPTLSRPPGEQVARLAW